MRHVVAAHITEYTLIVDNYTSSRHPELSFTLIQLFMRLIKQFNITAIKTISCDNVSACVVCVLVPALSIA